LLRAYFDNESPPTGVSKSDLEFLQKRADLALHTFKASFRGRFERNLDELRNMDFDWTIGKLLEWAQELLPSPSEDGNNHKSETLSNQEECAARLRALTSESGVPESCLWPFIKKLKVYVNAYILSKGLVIADLPGKRVVSFNSLLSD
jgi:hypothetical protein